MARKTKSVKKNTPKKSGGRKADSKKSGGAQKSGGDKKVAKKKKSAGYKTYITRITSDAKFTGESKEVFSHFTTVLAEAISDRARSSSVRNGKRTIRPNDVMYGVRASIPGAIARDALEAAAKAVNKFASYSPADIEDGKDRHGPVRNEKKAGLEFPVNRTRGILQGDSGLNISTRAPIILTAVLEYVTGQLIYASMEKTREDDKQQIKGRHILQAIEDDEEFNRLFKMNSFVLIGFGVTPLVIESDRKKRTKKNRRNRSTAISSIRDHQKDGSPILQNAPFNDFVRNVSGGLVDGVDLRFVNSAIPLLQCFVEHCVVDLYRSAMKSAIKYHDSITSEALIDMWESRYPSVPYTEEKHADAATNRIKQLAHRAGVKRFRRDSYDVCRQFIYSLVMCVAEKIASFQQYCGQVTVTRETVLDSISECGWVVVAPDTLSSPKRRKSKAVVEDDDEEEE